MKWKRKVSIVIQDEELILSLGENWSVVAKRDWYLVNAVKNGVWEEEELKCLIMEQDQCNDIVAGLTLAKFILDYQNYIEKEKGYFEIT